MSINIRPFQLEDSLSWDGFCESAYQSTLLHTRKFLSYHGDRFIDKSLIIEMGGNLVGILPAALDPGDVSCVVSHPGATYGGILHQGRLQGQKMVDTLYAIKKYYSDCGYKRFIYKVVPNFYHKVPSQDDLYAFYRLGVRSFRCDISSTIDLDNRQSTSQRRKRSLKKSLNAGVSVVEDNELLPQLWGVVSENLSHKHGVSPVHSLCEMELLVKRFPSQIRCICGLVDNVVVAGVLLFSTPTAFHSQYIASSKIGYEVSGLDAVFEFCIELAKREGKRWFDFGISTECGGNILNEGLYEFKSEFGGGGSIHEFFEIHLSE